MKKIALSFCFLILFGILAFLPVYSFNAVAEGEQTEPSVIEISSVDEFNTISDMSGHYKITEDLDFTAENFKPLGTKDIPFTGTLDGGGNRIIIGLRGIEIDKDASIGLINYASGATIKNLSLETDFLLKTPENSFINLNIGGIVGYADNGTQITNCKAQIILYSMDENQKFSAITDSSINFGAIVGEGRGIDINNSFAIVEVKLEQKGNALTESYIGGIAGKMENGSIHNVYVAPTEETVNSLTGVVADVENLNLQTSLTDAVSFGGIVGYVSGRQFEMFNTLFIGYLKASNRVAYAGLIGKMNANESLRPASSNISTSKYLTVNESSTVAFNKAVGNADTIAFVPSSTLSQITTMPNSFTYFEDATNGWNEIKGWDFANTWRTSTIYSATGIFLPDLQQFSELSIYLDYLNYSNYYTLNFKGKDKETTFAKFKIGDTVEIEAKFNVDSEKNVNYGDFYEFDRWQKVGDSSFSADGKVSLSFVCSNQTAGRYYISTVGKSVKVNIFITNENEESGNFGSVKNAGNVYTEQFSFTSKFASLSDPSVDLLVKLEAIDTTEEYVFSHFISGEEYFATNKNVSFKLDNKANKPKVFVENGELVCNITAVFTNNTSVLNINATQDAGFVKIDDGEDLSGEISKTVVNNKEYILTATAVEGYNFDGWYLGEEKIGEENILISKINEDTTIEAKFTKIITEENGINIWIIIGPIIGAVVLAGIIAIIVVKVKKNGANSYKRNFKY